MITYWYTSGNLIRLWDEQRLWGAYPKALWYTSELQLGNKAWLYEMESGYIPGMPIFVYFFEKGFNSFRENVVFFAYSFWILGLFLPAFKRIKRVRHLFTAIVVMLLTPVLFFNSGHDSGNYYKSIFIEPVLGMTLAYLVYSMIPKHGSNVCFEVFNLCVALGAIVLLKDAGIVFAFGVIIGVYGMCFLKENRKRYPWKYLLAVQLTPLVIYFSWSMITHVYGIDNHSASIEFVQLFDKEFIKNFIQYLMTEPIIISNISSFTPYLSTINVLCFLVVGNIIIIKNVEKGRKYIIPSISMGIIQIVFIVGLYFLCLKSFHKSFLSTLRYESAVLLGYFAFLLFISVDNMKRSSMICPKRGAYVRAVAYTLIIILAFPYRVPRTYINESVFGEAEQIAGELEEKIPVGISGPFDVFLVCDGWDEPLIHQRTYFNLIGKVNIKNYCNSGWIVSGEYSTNYFEEQEAGQRLKCLEKEIIQEGYDYIYICKADERFVELCGNFFGNQVSDHMLYRIEVIDGKIKMDAVEKNRK